MGLGQVSLVKRLADPGLGFAGENGTRLTTPMIDWPNRWIAVIQLGATSAVLAQASGTFTVNNVAGSWLMQLYGVFRLETRSPEQLARPHSDH